MKIVKLISALAVAVLSLTAWATPQPVQVVWPFAPGSSAAIMTRNLIDSANQQQNKYQFVFVNKPGAGGAVAARYTATTPNAVLLSGTGFYTRPLMYHESHSADQFQLISTFCSGVPMGMFVRKYSSVNELKNKELTVGIMPGSINQLFVKSLMQNNPEFKFVEVPFKNTPEQMTSMLGGHIDISIDFMSAGNLARMPADAKVLGISGTRTVMNVLSLNSMKVNGLENMVTSYYILAPRTMDSAAAQALNQIFNSATTGSAVQQSCTDEAGRIETTAFDRVEQVHRATMNYWQSVTKGIEKQ
jgi:tripartite-type tricarboxylate transporter receptor subunit TctC